VILLKYLDKSYFGQNREYISRQIQGFNSNLSGIFLPGEEMRGMFIIGTDTGVGKTIICGLLARYLLDKGHRVITQKWIQTGSKNLPLDINTHLKLMGVRKASLKKYLSLMSPYIFKLPASPHLAAYKEKKSIRPDKIKKSFRELAKNFDSVIVEGIGGALVPFSKKNLVIDIARELNLSVVIVAANKLGAINHTLLTIEAIKRRKIKIIGLIFNNVNSRGNKIILKDNPQIIKSLGREKTLGILPHIKNKDLLSKRFLPIGKSILKKIKNG